MKVDNDLFYICKDFIRDNKIIEEENVEALDPETISKFIVEVCELLGYHEEEEDFWEDSDEGC